MVTVQARFTSGELGGKRVPSCIGVGATGGQSPAYFYATGALTLERRADGSVWIRCDTLTAEQQHMSNVASSTGGWGNDDWYLQGLYCNRSDFDVTVSAAGISTAGIALTDPAKMEHEGYGTGNASDHTVTLSGTNSRGFQQIASSINELEHSSDGSTLWLYFAGGITFGQTVDTPVSIDAVRIEFSEQEIPKLFDYVPCAVKSGASWLSCNRSGGRLQLKRNGSWNDLKNSYGDGASSVFIRKDGSWVKSAKTGAE